MILMFNICYVALWCSRSSSWLASCVLEEAQVEIDWDYEISAMVLYMMSWEHMMGKKKHIIWKIDWDRLPGLLSNKKERKIICYFSGKGTFFSQSGYLFKDKIQIADDVHTVYGNHESWLKEFEWIWVMNQD